MARKANAVEAGARYLSWAGASAYTGLSTMTLRRLVKAGRLRLLLPAERCPRLDREELDALMRSGQSGERAAGTSDEA
jgi:excisionase family DNA binding protein